MTMKKIIITTIFISLALILNAQKWTVHDIQFRNSIVIDEQQKIYFSGFNGIDNFNNSKLTNFYHNQLPNRSFYSKSSLVIDGKGNKWLGYDVIYTDSGQEYESLCKINRDTTVFKLGDGSPANSIQCMVVDTKDNIWVGTYNGVYMFDGTKWTNYSTKDGLADNNINSIAIDSKGNKWFGTRANGVSKFDGTKWTTFTTSNGLITNYVRSMALDYNDNLWIGSNHRGVCKFNDKEFIDYTEVSGLETDSIGIIARDKNNNMWFAGNKGLTKFDGIKWTFYGFNSDSSYVGVTSNIAFDKDENPWVATYKAVYVLNKKFITGFYEDFKIINNNMNISPNPFTESTQIILPEEGVYQIRIINLQGKIIESFKSDQKIMTLNLSNFPRNIYRLEATHSNGQIYFGKLSLK